MEHLGNVDLRETSGTVPTLTQSPKLGERLNDSTRGKEIAKSSLDEYSKKSFAEALRLLNDTLKTKNIPLNVASMSAKIQAGIESVMNNPDIPNLAKQKFIKDVTDKLGLLKDLDMSDISTLRTRRAVESLGVEPIELKQKFGDDETKKQQFYLEKIIDETIANYITPAAHGLNQVFSQDKVTQISGKNYQKEGVEQITRSLQALDQKYGLNFGSHTQVLAFLDGKSDTRTKMMAEIQKGLLQKHPNGVWLGQMMKNGVITDSIKKGADIQVAGKTINIVEAYQQYQKVINGARATESEARETRSIARDTSLISRAKDVFGAEQLKSEFSRIQPADVASKLKGKSLSDMVIVATQLAQLAPLVGDIGGGLDGMVTAYGGMNVNGAKIDGLERTLNGIFGVLGISVVGGFAARAMKANKIPGLLQSFAVLQKELPVKIAEFTKSGNPLPVTVQKMLETLFPAMKPQYFVPNTPRKAPSSVPKNQAQAPIDPNKVQAAESRSGVASSEVLKNAKLGDPERLAVASTILGKPLTPEQSQTILRLHHDVSKGVYQNEFKELREMVKALQDVHIGPKESRKLMERGVLGSIDEPQLAQAIKQAPRTENFSSILQDINRDGMVGYLEKLEGKEIAQTTLNAIVFEMRGDIHIDSLPTLLNYFKNFDIRLPRGSEEEMFKSANKIANAKYINESIQQIKNIKHSDIHALCFKNGSIEHVALFFEFLNKGHPEEISKFMEFSRKNSELILPQVVADPSVLKYFLSKIHNNPVLFDQMLIPMIETMPKLVLYDSIKLLEQAIQSLKNRPTGVSPRLLSASEAKIELLIKSNNPDTLVKAYLNGIGDRDSQIRNLKINGGPIHQVWNRDFDLLRGTDDWQMKQVEMIRRGDPAFFSVYNLGNFFSMTFMELPKNVQKEIIALMKPGQPYNQIPEEFPRFQRYAQDAGLI